MSYILEALKKSEQERNRGGVPDIKTVHTYIPQSIKPRQSLWPWILLGVALINAIIIFVIYLNKDTPTSKKSTSTQMSNVTQSVQPKPEIVAKTSDAPPIAPVSTPSVKKPEPTSQPTVSTKHAPEPTKPNVVFSKTPLSADNTVGNIAEQNEKTAALANKPVKPGKVKKDKAVLPSELPEQIKRQIPNIAFEGHVYTSNVASRSVMINGKKMREGDSLSGGLTLKAITSVGAEFEYQGYLFRLNALQDWSYR